MITSFLDWFENNKFGVIGTLTLHTTILFVLSFMQLKNASEMQVIGEMPMEVLTELETEELMEQLLEAEQGAPEKVTNLTSNIAAQLRPSYDRQRLAESVENEVAAEAQAEFDRLEQERAARGESDPIMPELDPSKWNKDRYMDKAAEPVRVEGATTVWHDLKDPLRAERHIHVPAYICKGFGLVVVNVSVDRDGQVRKAELDATRTNVQDDCMVGNALRSAREASFAANGAAPEQQRGSIFYRFMPQ